MTGHSKDHQLISGIVTVLLLGSVFFSGCTGASPQEPVPVPTSAQTTVIPAAPVTSSPPVMMTAVPVSSPAVDKKTSMTAPGYPHTEGTVVVFLAASLKGVSQNLSSDFETMFPGYHVVFNPDGTQALRTQVQNGAYCDVFISASATYTAELARGGYFVHGTVRPLTSNYMTVILPADNPADIRSLADLSKPGVKIARGDRSVPVGTATDTVLANLANSTYGQEWNSSVYKNTVTYETSEPNVAAKVALGEVDAGFVYASTATAAPKGTYSILSIPKTDNYLQTYTIGIMNQSADKDAAADFETFMLSAAGQKDLRDYGFGPV